MNRFLQGVRVVKRIALSGIDIEYLKNLKRKANDLKKTCSVKVKNRDLLKSKKLAVIK